MVVVPRTRFKESADVNLFLSRHFFHKKEKRFLISVPHTRARRADIAYRKLRSHCLFSVATTPTTIPRLLVIDSLPLFDRATHSHSADFRRNV